MNNENTSESYKMYGHTVADSINKPEPKTSTQNEPAANTSPEVKPNKKEQPIAKSKLMIICYLSFIPVTLLIQLVMNTFAMLAGETIDHTYLAIVSFVSITGATVFEYKYYNYRMKKNKEIESRESSEPMIDKDTINELKVDDVEKIEEAKENNKESITVEEVKENIVSTDSVPDGETVAVEAPDTEKRIAELEDEIYTLKKTIAILSNNNDKNSPNSKKADFSRYDF